jgi:hypothetical protein
MASLVSREHLQRQLRAWVDEGRLVKAAQTCLILRGQPVRGTSNLLGAYAVLLFTPPDTLQGVQSVAVTLDLFPSVRPPEGGVGAHRLATHTTAEQPYLFSFFHGGTWLTACKVSPPTPWSLVAAPALCYRCLRQPASTCVNLLSLLASTCVNLCQPVIVACVNLRQPVSTCVNLCQPVIVVNLLSLSTCYRCQPVSTCVNLLLASTCVNLRQPVSTCYRCLRQPESVQYDSSMTSACSCSPFHANQERLELL